ncbi:hypothetical protein PG988_011311 [Apiospora saccharicola]
MAATGAEAPAAMNGDHDHILRPRPRKPQNPQVAELTRQQSNVSITSSNGFLTMPENGTASGLTSGRSTPVPEDAPQSTKALSYARKQVRAEQRRRLFPTIDYTARVSHFDPQSDYRDFHGFFNLFWIGLAIMAITSMLRNIKDTGSPLRVQIWTLFTVKLNIHEEEPGWHALEPGGMAVQSIYQVLWLSFWVFVPFALHWTWTAQVFFLLHTMVLLMKMHSYAFYNGHLSETEKRLQALDDPMTTESKAPAYVYPTVENPMGEFAHKSKVAPSDNGDNSDNGSNHSDAEIERLAQLRADLARELTSPIGNITYPRNLNWPNYADYLLCPTLCYELEYPRNDRINWTPLIAKVVATFGCIFLLTIISEEFILPVLQESHRGLSDVENNKTMLDTLLILAETISWLLFPFMLTFLLVFLVIFEYVLGAFAEITRFADRHFYSDWWNSTDWMEFSREWNVPVYSFLRRHVYATSRQHIGRPMATLLTFLVSALGHEIVMACITKKVRGYGFICQMLQLPIVMLQRTRWVRGKETLNNVCFWCSMVMGLSLICSLYVLV